MVYSVSSLMCAAVLSLWVSTIAVADEAEPPAAVVSAWRKAIMNDNVDSLGLQLSSAAAPRQLVGVRSANGKTGLMIAAKLGAQELFDSLLALGADIHAATATGGTPVMYAALGGHTELARQLLALGADVNAVGSNGWSSLTIAAAKGYARLAGTLIDAGADINAHDVYGWTPLMRAVDNRHQETVFALLSRPGVSLDHQDEAGNTALHYAARHSDAEVAKALLDKGARQDIRNRLGQRAADVAIEVSAPAAMQNLFKAAQ